jgi:hypothetical protein
MSRSRGLCNVLPVDEACYHQLLLQSLVVSDGKGQSISMTSVPCDASQVEHGYPHSQAATNFRSQTGAEALCGIHSALSSVCAHGVHPLTVGLVILFFLRARLPEGLHQIYGKLIYLCCLHT